MVTAALPGRSAVDPVWLAEPAAAVAAVGRGLRALHDTLPVADCPFSWSATGRVADAQRRAGEIDPSTFHAELRHLTVAEALAAVADPPPADRLVVAHGDPCAPNTLVADDGAVAGHVDLGELGVADRWADLAVATWATVWNYGPGWGAHCSTHTASHPTRNAPPTTGCCGSSGRSPLIIGLPWGPRTSFRPQRRLLIMGAGARACPGRVLCVVRHQSGRPSPTLAGVTTDAPAPAVTGAPSVAKLLGAAVTALGGTPREGQQAMASAVERALRTGDHLAVQAGTGTGKSLAYLVPGIQHALESEQAVVVSTATIALQTQLVDRDLPRLAAALEPVLGRKPSFAILKGRANYLCRHKVDLGAQAATDDPGDEQLFDPFQVSALGRQVTRLYEWSETTTTGDRDELAPGVTDRAWRQVSVSARECLGASRCPVAEDCFAEHARHRAGQADVVVTNHAMLAISMIGAVEAVLPEHDVVVVDEAHNLVDRVTSVATGELAGSAATAAAKRCGRLVDQAIADALVDAGEGLETVLADERLGRWEHLPEPVGRMLSALRNAAWSCRQALGPDREHKREKDENQTSRKFALALVEEVHDVAGRLLAAFEREDVATRPEVVWCVERESGSTTTRALHVAPLSVAGLLASQLFGRSTVVMTSATLVLGGTFDALARQWGLPVQTSGKAITELAPDDGGGHDPTQHADRDPATNLVWHGLDVGSPFAHGKAGILYLARHLPPPGRDGLSPACLDEIEGLVRAAGGRGLGLFSSMRAAKQAAEHLRGCWDGTVLCQGEDATGTLVARFAADVASVLFGTLSLWQGVDVPGESLQLVMIDRIPFPRPDDPLMSARQRAVDARGGNGFLTVSATHAALLLAQGAGRLLRGSGDRGVVALLDSRVATKQYGGFLRGSLPPFWTTHDPAVVRGALERLRGA